MRWRGCSTGRHVAIPRFRGGGEGRVRRTEDDPQWGAMNPGEMRTMVGLRS